MNVPKKRNSLTKVDQIIDNLTSTAQITKNTLVLNALSEHVPRLLVIHENSPKVNATVENLVKVNELATFQGIVCALNETADEDAEDSKISLKRLMALSEDAKAVLQDSITKVMQRLVISTKCTKFQEVHLYLIQHLLPDLLSIGVAQNNAQHNRTGSVLTAQHASSNRLLACATSIVRHMSAADCEIDFVKSVAGNQWKFLIYLFSSADNIVREYLPEYSRPRRNSHMETFFISRSGTENF